MWGPNGECEASRVRESLISSSYNFSISPRTRLTSSGVTGPASVEVLADDDAESDPAVVSGVVLKVPKIPRT